MDSDGIALIKSGILLMVYLMQILLKYNAYSIFKLFIF